MALVFTGESPMSLGGHRVSHGQKKPILIRADRTSNKDESEIILPNPAQVKHNIRIGDFYFRKKNYKAALKRYHTALEYGLKNPAPHLRVVKTQEIMGQPSEALATCRRFMKMNPDSPRLGVFMDRIRKIKSSMSN
jgi:tetratricopeptide (TPR) repeat protein